MIAILGLGILIISDGVGSIIVYRKQKWYEHTIRILRVSAGATLVVLGILV